MIYDFDTVVDRRGTNSLKYDFAVERGKPEDVIPLWVADMDFLTAKPILEQLEKSVKHGIFGYSDGKEAYVKAVLSWYKDHFGWDAKKEWLIQTPGVVFAIAMALKAFTKEGDSVLLQQPVYYPFSEMIRDNGRRLVNRPLKLVDGHYEMDFEDLEQKIVSEQVKLFLLCSPHNPVGRVWKKEELQKVGDICLKHNVFIISDEIHSDFVNPGYQHTVFASLSEEFKKITITCTSPSKTFNLAGLQISNIFIPNPKLRLAFKKEIAKAGYSQVNVMGLVACQAAYEKGEEWLAKVKDYLLGNLQFVREFLNSCLPRIKLIEPEGTYLIWLDFREFGLSEKEREDLIVNKARLWLDSGAIFGSAGEGFERINIACPRETLKKALNQLYSAINDKKV